MKKRIYFLSFILSGVVFAQENKKPFILEHLKHEHQINIVNATVLQSIKDYSAVYNSSHVFFTLYLTQNDEVFFNSSITFGNGIRKKIEEKGYTLSPTADDLEDDLKDINGTGRKYLLELYYLKRIKKLTVAGGLIDSTAFIDTNRFANDELTQFLNESLVNNPIADLPSYNPGVYVKYNLNNENSVSTVIMSNKPEDELVYIAEYEFENESFGLRPYVFKTEKTDQNGFGISSDFSIYNNLGLFFRGGYSNQDLNLFFSAGLSKDNTLLKNDTFAVGSSFINNKHDNAKDIKVIEAYYKIRFKKYFTFTFDAQYMKEENEDIILGGRFYISF